MATPIKISFNEVEIKNERIEHFSVRQDFKSLEFIVPIIDSQSIVGKGVVSSFESDKDNSSITVKTVVEDKVLFASNSIESIHYEITQDDRFGLVERFIVYLSKDLV